jgi:hypothetical protein
MTAMTLTSDTKARLKFLFPESEWAPVEKILMEECGNNLPFLDDATPEDLERFQFAALKLSNGNFLKLKEAVELAKADWRDLLVAAKFANDEEAHKKWEPRKRDRKFQQSN